MYVCVCFCVCVFKHKRTVHTKSYGSHTDCISTLTSYLITSVTEVNSTGKQAQELALLYQGWTKISFSELFENNIWRWCTWIEIPLAHSNGTTTVVKYFNQIFDCVRCWTQNDSRC